MNEEKQMESVRRRHYQIVVAGELDPSWSEWLGGMQFSAGLEQDGSSVTLLRGEIPDQAALRSILNKIWDLRLNLLSVSRVQEII